MPQYILMPALSPTMTEGKLARWVKKQGDRVRAGDVVAEIETDKATMEVEAVDEGVLEKILVPEGTEGVLVNTPIAQLSGEGGIKIPVPAQAKESAPVAAAPAPSVAPVAVAPAATVVLQAVGAPAQRLAVSPLARRIAAQQKLELSNLKGSGPHGRIVRADVELALASRGAAPAVAAPAATGAAVEILNRGGERVALNMVRKVTARRLSESKQTVPHFYVSIDLAMDALLDLRARLNAKSPASGPGVFKLSVNDLLIKAVAATLARVKDVNTSFAGDAIFHHEHIDVAVAVSIPNGLITPVLRDADKMGLASISREMAALVVRARENKLKPEEYQGGTFSISNMGMYGVREFSAIISPPQAGILAVAAVEDRAVVRNGAIVAAKMMTATLSVDHRVVDGALAAQFCAVLKEIVEEPLTLML